MIISHKHKCILVRPWKVGGSSVGYALACHCGPDDVVAAEDKYNPAVDATPYEWKPRNDKGIWKHATMAEVRALVTEQQWREYRKIVIVRNPWDNFVSFFSWVMAMYGDNAIDEMRIPRTFDAFVSWNLFGRYPLNKAHWMPDGKTWADFHLRFEALEADCRSLFCALGLPPLDVLPKLKVRLGEQRAPYETFYTKAVRDMVAQRYAVEAECFGYSFEGQ